MNGNNKEVFSFKSVFSTALVYVIAQLKLSALTLNLIDLREYIEAEFRILAEEKTINPVTPYSVAPNAFEVLNISGSC